MIEEVTENQERQMSPDPKSKKKKKEVKKVQFQGIRQRLGHMKCPI